MRCFFSNDACHGHVRRAGGHTDSLWLPVDHGAGYCEGHLNMALFSARWEMGRVHQMHEDGHRTPSRATAE